MTVRIHWLRKFLDESCGEPAEIPVGAFGFGDGLRVLFPDGIVRFTSGIDAFSGTARVSFADSPASARLGIGRDGEGVALEVRLPAPGASAQLLARCVGFEVPELPCGFAESLTLRLDDEVGATLLAAGAGTTIALCENGERIFTASAAGWQVLCIDTALPVTRLAHWGISGGEDLSRTLLPDRFADELPPGSWLLLPEPGLSPRRFLVPLVSPRPDTPLDPSRVDGLGRPMPVPTARARRTGSVFRPARAVATADGFALLAGTRASLERGNGRFGLTLGEDGAIANVEFDYSPMRIGGALGLMPASSPYKTVIGGVLMFSFKGAKSGIYGTGMGAYVVPESGAANPSLFAYVGIGGDPGIGIPCLRLTGVSAGFGWNSRVRVPEIENVSTFPFLKALDDPGAIGAGKGDPVEVLRALTAGSDAWVTPRDDELWVAAGLGFTLVELISGRALAVLQTGDEFTLSLLGSAAAEFPKAGSKKYARVAADLRAVLKPNQGELAFDMLLRPDSFVIDPNCRLRGGVAFRAWFGSSPHAGDFVYTVGGFHPNYRAPQHYPIVPRLGFDWDLTGSVTISGSAYLAITPAAAMVGGALAVRFHSGVVRAWCTADMNALIQWKPFYIDVGMRVSIGVSASVKIIFVRITITVEVGVGLAIWGPPTGGQAKVKLWFISFTINFGNGRAGASNELDWAGFSAMLPPANNNVRILPQAGLLAEQHPGTRDGDDYWEVSASGFTFDSDTTVPITRVHLGKSDGTFELAETGSTVNLRPTKWRGVTCNQRVTLTLGGDRRDLGAWTRSRRMAAISAELWGSGNSGSLPSGDDQLVKNQLLGVELTSPAPQYGTSTGFIDERAISFDTVTPDGRQPLDPDGGPIGATPRRPGDVITTIATTVAATPQTDARRRLAGQLSALGFDLGQIDSDLSGYARACQTAFTAEPMLVG
ncbi:DUF6603 domain-containing protein [Nocardia sp. NPDC004711]